MFKTRANTVLWFLVVMFFIVILSQYRFLHTIGRHEIMFINDTYSMGESISSITNDTGESISSINKKSNNPFIDVALSDGIPIVTSHYSGPQFIRLQYYALKKFMMEPYQYIVVNDAPMKSDAYTQITLECNSLGIKCFHIPDYIHKRMKYLPRRSSPDSNNPAIRCSVMIQWLFEHFVYGKKGNIVVMDGDLIPFAPFNPSTYLTQFDIVYVAQWRSGIHYAWNGFIMLNRDDLPMLKSLSLKLDAFKQGDGLIQTDVGGNSHFYLKKYKGVIKTKSVDFSASSLYESLGGVPDWLLPVFKYNAGPKLYEFEYCPEMGLFHHRVSSKWAYDKSDDIHYNSTLRLQFLTQTFLNETLSPEDLAYENARFEELHHIYSVSETWNSHRK